MFKTKVFDIIDCIPFYVASFYIAFSCFFDNDNFILAILFVSYIVWFIAKYLNNNLILHIDKQIALWFLFIFFFFISFFYSIDKINTFKFSIVFFMFIFMGVGTSFCKNKIYYDRFIYSLLFFLSLHLIFTFVSLININIVVNICQYIYGHEVSMQIKRWALEFHSYSGISNQIGLNAIFQTIILSISFSALLCLKSNRMIALLLTIFGWIALLLTGKETFYLANILASIFLIFLFLKDTNPKSLKKLYYIVIVFIFLFIIFLVFNFKDLMDLYYDRSIDSRLVLYKGAIDAIKQAPIFGNGANTIFMFTDHLTHNIYLQIIAELGIIGLILFFIASLYSCYISYINANKKCFFIYLKLYLFIILFIDGFFGNPLFDYRFLIPFFIICFATYPSKNIQLHTKKDSI